MYCAYPFHPAAYGLSAMGVTGSKAYVDAGSREGGATGELKRLCREFEAVLLEQILECAGLFEEEKEEVLLGATPFTDVREQMARALAQAGGLGLGDLLFRWLASGGIEGWKE